MSVAVPGIREGLSPFDTILRIVENVDRLHQLADVAQSRGRVADAVHAVQAETKVLNYLLTLAVKGQTEVNLSSDAFQLEEAVAALTRSDAAVGEAIGDALVQAGRSEYGARFKAYAEKVRVYQTKILETNQESTNE